METSTEPREFVAQGDRVLIVGFASGKVKATNKPFEDDWIFAITVRDGRLTSIQEYIDTNQIAGAVTLIARKGWHAPRRWTRPGPDSAGLLQPSAFAEGE